jgi:hypothetical protein
MGIIYKCDVCGEESFKDELINFQLFRKSQSKKLGGKRLDCKDICLNCYQNIFKTKLEPDSEFIE